MSTPQLLQFARLRWTLSLFLAVASCRPAPISTRLDSSAGGDVAQAASTGPSSSAPAGGLEAALRAFPGGAVVGASGPRGLTQELARLLELIASDGGQEVEIAFVVDRGAHWDISSALDRAMAANRQRLARVGRTALVSVGFAPTGWSARVDVPLGGDPYDVQRTARRLHLDQGPRGTGATWAGLEETSRLSWKPSARPQVVLLTDDRSWSALPRDPGAPPLPSSATSSDPPAALAQRERVAAWARRTGADLYAIRCQFELNDGRTDPSNPAVERPDLGDPLNVASGFFRDGSYVAASSNVALTDVVNKALARAAIAPGGVDVALVVDRTGRMGASLGTLRGMRSAFEGFVASTDHRLAIVGWGEGPAAVSLPFARPPESIERALIGLRPAPSNDQGKDLRGALDVARQLGWRPESYKAIIVLTATTWYWGRPFTPLEDWTDDAHVTVTFVEPP